MFTAELKLEKYMCAKEREEKKIVLKVADAKLQIFCVEKQDDDGKSEKQNENEKQNGNVKRWSSVRNSLKKLQKNSMEKLNSIMVAGGDKKSKKWVLNENDLQPYGYISLPNYIISDTLQVSINVFGNLQIAACMKGAITNSLTFKRRTLQLGSPLHARLVRQVSTEHARLVRQMSEHARNSPLLRRLSRQGSNNGSESDAQDAEFKQISKKLPLSKIASSPPTFNYM